MGQTFHDNVLWSQSRLGSLALLQTYGTNGLTRVTHSEVGNSDVMNNISGWLVNTLVGIVALPTQGKCLARLLKKDGAAWMLINSLLRWSAVLNPSLNARRSSSPSLCCAWSAAGESGTGDPQRRCQAGAPEDAPEARVRV